MISFKGRCETIRNADRITRYVNSVYPHVSVSRTQEKISRQVQKTYFGSPKVRRLSDLKLKYADKINRLRFMMDSGMSLLRCVINSLKDSHIGNCYEDARLAEIIGKINGQENIYPMSIYISRNKSGALMPLDHVVAVISDKKFEPKGVYFLKNKDAIILDPWLCVTDFASNYAEKIKNGFADSFDNMSDNTLSMRFLARISKNLEEYRQNKRAMYNPEIRFMLHSDGVVTNEEAGILRHEYPELVIKDFKSL